MELPALTFSYNIKGFVETSFVDWPGRLCAVLFLPGCNFRCPYCHNPDLATGGRSLPAWRFSSILKRLGELKGWVESVCITGGEATIHNFLPDLLFELKDKGFQTKLDTNGSNPKVLEYLFQKSLIDFVAMDVKAPLSEPLYGRCTGVIPPLAEIKESIELIMEEGTAYQFRTTIVPRLLGIEDVLNLAGQLRGAKDYKLQNFNPGATLDPAFQNEPPYEYSTFRELQRRCLDIISLRDLEAGFRA
ncbi:MAG: anaerobic ribonucleoside-triphosphate reductase activating protein [Pseudomonadota bacterium]